jgi:hypothetical protein
MNFMLQGIIQLNILPFPLYLSAIRSFPDFFRVLLKGKKGEFMDKTYGASILNVSSDKDKFKLLYVQSSDLFLCLIVGILNSRGNKFFNQKNISHGHHIRTPYGIRMSYCNICAMICFLFVSGTIRANSDLTGCCKKCKDVIYM